jgi:hypothetical protein
VGRFTISVAYAERHGAAARLYRHQSQSNTYTPTGKGKFMKRSIPEPTPDPLANLTPAAEGAIIGAILTEGVAAFDQAAQQITSAGQFTDPECRAIWTAAASRNAEGKPLSAAMLAEVAGIPPARIATLTESACFVHEAASYAAEVKEAAAKRELRYQLVRATSDLGDVNNTADFVAAVLSGRLRSFDSVPDSAIQTDTLTAVMASEPPPPPCVIDEIFGPGDIFQINAPSKARKSFLLLQLGMSVSAGLPFLGVVTSARPVVLLNLEIRPEHFRLRMWRMARALQLDLATAQPFTVIHGRGRDTTDILREVETTAKRIGAGVVAVDPVYKLSPAGNENESADAKGIVATLDRLAEATGAAVCYVHHTPKGAAGDRAAIDRGAGHGVLARAFDACLSIIPHKSEPGAMVAEYILRNYAPREAFAIRWTDGRFTLADDLEATGETSASRRAASMRGPDADTLTDKALAMINGKVWPLARFKATVAGKLGLGEKRTRDLIDLVRSSPNVGCGRHPAFGAGFIIGPVDLVTKELGRAEA